MPPAETAPLIYSDDEEAGSPGVRRVRRSRERARPGLPTSDGLWTPTEKWLGASSVFLLLLACIFGGLFVAGPRADLPPPPPPKAPDREAPCVTPDCVLVAAGIIASIDFNIDPCDDFYSFACGGWIATNPIPAHKSRYGTFDQLAEANRKVLQNILESPYSVSPSVPRGGRDADKNNFDKMVGIYNSCMNETDIRVKAIQPVRDLLAKTRNELFPVPELNSSKFGEVIGNLHNLDLGPLFGFGVDADLKDPDKNTLYLDQGGLGLPSREYYKDEKIVAVYESVIADELALVLSATPSINETHPFPSSNYSQVAQTIVTFESKLAEITLPADQIQEQNKTYNPYNLSSLIALAPGFDWQTYLETRFAAAEFPRDLITEETVLIVGMPVFFANLSTLLAETSTETMEYYLTWSLIRGYGGFVSDAAKEPLRRLREALTGVKSTIVPPRWEVCVDTVDSVMGFALGKWFVDRVFTPDAKAAADATIDYVKRMMVARLPSLDWIDEKTRGLAAEKVESLKRKIGYPDWIMVPSKVAERYSGLEVGDYFATMVSAATYAVKRNLAKILKPVDREEWGMTPQTVNAYYNPPLNEIVFPAGILQPPFFSPKFPAYINYGAIGSVVGHELTHAFDNNGRSYDAEGRLRDWWTPETAAQFKERSKCFIEQYGRYTVKDAEGKEEHVNGKLTLGENLADNGGLARAVEAWKDEYSKGIPVILNRNFNLPGLNYTRSQMIYIGFSQVWCSLVRPETAIQRIRTDPHSPANWRVIGALSDSEGFAEAWGCPKKARMNPEGKCVLW